MIGLMAYYPAEVGRRLASPDHAKRPPEAAATGISASFQCGTFVRVFLTIKMPEGRITDAGFLSNGCGFAVATADVIVGILRGRSLKELGSFTDETLIAAVTAELGPFPPGRSQCLELAIDAVREALADHRAKCLHEFHGERPLVCTCFGVAEDTVQELIIAHHPSSVDEITRLCNAGGGCGSCLMLLEEMLTGTEQAGRT